MSWTEIASAVSVLVAVASAAWQFLRHLMSGSYATRDQLLSVEKALTSVQVLHSAETGRAHHRIDLVIEGLKAVPGYSHLNDLKAQVSDLDKKVAVSSSKLDAMGDDIHQIRAAVERISEDMRNNRHNREANG